MFWIHGETSSADYLIPCSTKIPTKVSEIVWGDFSNYNTKRYNSSQFPNKKKEIYLCRIALATKIEIIKNFTWVQISF